MARVRMEVLEVLRSEQGFILEAVNITPEGLDQEYERKKADSKVWGLNKWKEGVGLRKFAYSR